MTNIITPTVVDWPTARQIGQLISEGKLDKYKFIVSIRSPMNQIYEDINFGTVPALKVNFDDVTNPRWNYTDGTVPPNEEQIQLILTHAKPHRMNELLVHCKAGLSRSPAVALLLMIQYYGVDRAEECIDALFHWYPDVVPNGYIMTVGEDLLKIPRIRGCNINGKIAEKAGLDGEYP